MTVPVTVERANIVMKSSDEVISLPVTYAVNGGCIPEFRTTNLSFDLKCEESPVNEGN